MKPNIQYFMTKCINEKEFMQNEREVLSTKWLSIKYEVSENIVCKYLWKGKKKVFPEISVVEEMRKTMSDWKISMELGVSEMWIRRNCKDKEIKKRKESIGKLHLEWLSPSEISKQLEISIQSVIYHTTRIDNPYTKKSPVTIAKESIEPRILNKWKWKQPKEHNYKVYGEVVTVGSRPIPWIKLEKNTCWYTF